MVIIAIMRLGRVMRRMVIVVNKFLSSMATAAPITLPLKTRVAAFAETKMLCTLKLNIQYKIQGVPKKVPVRNTA